MRLLLAAALAALTISCSDDSDPATTDEGSSSGDTSSTGEPDGSSGGSTGAQACAPGAPCDPANADACGTLMECLEIQIGQYACIRPCRDSSDCVAVGGGFCSAAICKNGDAYAGKCFFE